MPSDNNEPEKQVISWTELESHVVDLSVLIKEAHPGVHRIMAVARGGLIPATLLSHTLGINTVASLQLRAYKADNTPNSWVEVVNPCGSQEAFDVWMSSYDNRGTLVVDDIYDTGKTQNRLKQLLPNAVYCSVFNKSAHQDPLLGIQLDPKIWFVFPWERVAPNGLS